ncbi:MAG: enoyl-CoA hydratase-related protein [Desulfatirhabdiaceae bacterium]
MSLIFEKQHMVALITLNRPDAHNSIDPETVVDLVSAWTEYEADKTLRCAIITGAGDRSFCSGADLARLIPLFTGARKPETDADFKVQSNPMMAQQAFLRDMALKKPLIAAINGNAIAGGMELLYSADIRVASHEARFGLQEVKWAIFPMGGSTVRLPRQLPFCKTMELLLTGDLMDAAEAFRLGFLNKVVSQDKVLEEAMMYAEKIAKNGPMAVSAIKQSVLSNLGKPVSEGLNTEMEFGIPVFLSRDAREGPRAFKEKREPVYRGE